MNLLSLFRKNEQKHDAEDINSPASASAADVDAQSVKPRKRRSSLQAGTENTRILPVDPVLPEKKRARRRLVGAVALVLAAIIGLPMILDSEPRPLSPDLVIDIPSKDAGGARAAATAPRQEGTSGSKRSQEAPTSSVPGTSVAQGAKEPVASTDAALSNNEKPAAVQVPATSDVEADDHQAKYILQVGAFASQEKVSQLRGKLKTAGIMSHTQKISTDKGERVRIRIGPFNSKIDAEKMRVKLAGMGLNAKLSPQSLP